MDRLLATIFIAAALTLLTGWPASVSLVFGPDIANAQAPAQGCVPISQRGDREFGCFLTASEKLGKLPQVPLHWHLDLFPTRDTAEAAQGPRSSVVESYGKIWLFTIAEEAWRANGGKRVARVGPLPVGSAEQYTAQYMEGTFRPGMVSVVHRHPGPEAWYTLEGEMCLETPDGKMVSRAGESTIVPAGLPMVLTGLGTSTRRSLVLILHDSSLPAGNPAKDWQPKGLCND